MSRSALAILGIALLLAAGESSARDAADTARARVLAQLGLQDAETKLKAFFPIRTFDSPNPSRFWGADKTETSEPAPNFPAENAANPSFAVEVDGNPDAGPVTPRTVVVEGAERGFSGGDGAGTYATNGDQYALKVSDLSGRIYVNDGIDAGASGSVSQNLKRILNVLGQMLAVPQLGDKVLSGRPAAGYQNASQLVAALGSPQDYARVRDHVTIFAWVDPHVANPVPLSMGKLGEYPVQYYRGSPPVFRHGSVVSGLDSAGNDVIPSGGLNTCPNVCAGGSHDNPSIRLYGLDSLNPQWIEIVSRAPVNVNAASREVLVALLTDLRGFFVADRRRNNPRWKGDLYLAFKLQSTFSPNLSEGDEIGFLMDTLPVVGPGGIATAGISAYVIADEIVACRSRKATANFNYATTPWAGPFRTWRQFHQFVDNLALPKASGGAGVLDDTRPIHKDYEEEVDDPAGYGALVDSVVQRRHAVRAIADVLKANFNPNLHLNETNPDENLYLRVDKTDLIVNSTELCFVPTGYFEVESVGRVLRPKDGAADALAAADNELVGQAKFSAVFRIYDLYRETNQKQFYAGTASPRSGGFETNNDASLEVGPEPDNGVFPGNLGAAGNPDNEWDGYVALPTVGGIFGGHGAPAKAKNTLVRTLDLPAAPYLNSAMHVHFTLDSDACHHLLSRQEIASRTLSPADESVENYPDPLAGFVVPYPGPYDPTKGPAGAHRVCRSFRGTPALVPYAPSDLRIDGLLAERHSAPAYFVQQAAGSIWPFSTTNASGMVSFWLKPSFFPDLTGKVRKVWDMSRYHNPCAQGVYVWPFEMLFYPSNYSYQSSESVGPRLWANNVGQFQPCSFSWGSMTWHSDSITTIGGANSQHQFGKMTNTLNHLSHDDCMQLNSINPNAKMSPFRAHRWMSVSFSWNLVGSWDPSGHMLNRLFINGTSSGSNSPYTPWTWTTMTGGWQEGYNRMNGFERHAGNEFNQMRLGGTSQIAVGARMGTMNGAYRGNYSADFTYDELYVWQRDSDGDPILLWQRGRYAKPLSMGEGIFTSQPIALPPAAAPAVTRVLAVSWTWMGEGVDWSDPFLYPGGKPIVYDYSDPYGVAVNRIDVQPRVGVAIRDGALLYGPFDRDDLSAVRDSGGSVPVILDPTQVRYVAVFELANAQIDTILLTTPVLDDVTLYWTDGRANTRVDSISTVSITGPGSLPDGAGGTPYAATFTASNPSATWTVSGNLPPGMSIDPATGVYSGTPTTGGTYTFLVTATDETGSSSTQYSHGIVGNAPGGGGGSDSCGGCGALGPEALVLWLLLGAAYGRRTRRP